MWVLALAPLGRAGGLPAISWGRACCICSVVALPWGETEPLGAASPPLLTQPPHRWATRTPAPQSSWWTSMASTTSLRSTPACRWSTRSRRRSPSELGLRGRRRGAGGPWDRPRSCRWPGGWEGVSPVCFKMSHWAAAEEQGGHELSSLFSVVNVVRDLVLTSHKNITW